MATRFETISDDELKKWRNALERLARQHLGRPLQAAYLQTDTGWVDINPLTDEERALIEPVLRAHIDAARAKWRLAPTRLVDYPAWMEWTRLHSDMGGVAARFLTPDGRRLVGEAKRFVGRTPDHKLASAKGLTLKWRFDPDEDALPAAVFRDWCEDRGWAATVTDVTKATPARPEGRRYVSVIVTG